MINLIPNFQPFLALALFMPLLPIRKEFQYGLPIIALASYYLLSVGLDVAQLGYFASVLLATYIASKTTMLKAYFISMFGYHVLANLSHGNPFTLTALEFDASTFTATAMYLTLFEVARRLVMTSQKLVRN